jgi:hypothetical protein
MGTASNVNVIIFFLRALALALMGSLAACGGDSGSNYTAPPGAPTAADLTTGDSVTTSPAIAGSANVSAPGSVPAVAASASATLKEQIGALERSGAYPALDRSSDIAGPDVNGNSVRDDIEAWISAQPVTDVQRKALMQKAKALQRTLMVDVKDSAALQRSGDALMASTNCGGDVFSPYVVFSRLAGKIEAMTADTRERARQYMRYNAASSGSSTTLPNGNTCEP